MSGIREYFLRLIFCGFLVSLVGSLTTEKRIKRIVSLCGGCLILITAVRPLLSVDLQSLPDRLRDLGLSTAITQEEARARNDGILAALVTEQTEERIRTELDRQKAGLAVTVRVERDPETGLFLPAEVTLRGSCSPEQKKAVSDYLERELDLPPDKQVWRME